MEGLAAGHVLNEGQVYALKRPRYEGEGYIPYPYSMCKHSLPEDMFFIVATGPDSFRPHEMSLQDAEAVADFRGLAQEYEVTRPGQLPSRRQPMGGPKSHQENDVIMVNPPEERAQTAPVIQQPAETPRAPATSALESLVTQTVSDPVAELEL